MNRQYNRRWKTGNVKAYCKNDNTITNECILFQDGIYIKYTF